MKLIGITPRVEVIKAYQERRDALDQRWFELLHQCGYLTIVLPTAPKFLANYLTDHSITWAYPVWRKQLNDLWRRSART